MEKLIEEIKKCTVCLPHLVDGVNPVVTARPESKIAIIGQAPGVIVHKSGKPWDDKSGERLRAWMGVSEEQFYDTSTFAIIPMGFCYPGKGKSGDLAPRKECAPLWREALFSKITDLRLTLLIGNYAQKYYLREKARKTLTDTVKNHAAYLPTYLPLPHPSPRNNIWLKKNQWFEQEVIPELQLIIKNVL
jgi:uracil-DNA glycosylase